MIRIEPAYMVSALIVIALQLASALAPGSKAAMPDLGVAESLALHFAYLAPWFDVPWLSPVYWSLAIEFQYYIAMLFFAPLLLSKQRSCVRLFLISAAALSFAFQDPRTVFPYLPLFGFGFVRFLGFRKVLSSLELMGWAVIFFGLSWRILDVQQALAAAFAFGLLFVPLRKPVPVLTFLGSISFSLYLIHVPVGGRVINLATRLPSTSSVYLMAVICAAAASIVAAYLFWRVVENPSARLSKHIGTTRKRLNPTSVTSMAKL